MADVKVTRITNASGATKFFGFIPPHGKELTAGESTYVFGDIENIIANPVDGAWRKVNVEAFNKASEAGDITVIRETLDQLSSSSLSNLV